MKETPLTKIADEVIESKLKAIDAYIEEIIEPLEKIGSPESLIGKKYEEWTPLDFQLLVQIYGLGDETPLAKLIFNKEYEKVRKLEEM
jgi:hypothetical protein